MSNTQDIDSIMMQGFEPLTDYFARRPLGLRQNAYLQAFKLLLRALEFGYAPIKHLVDKPDILRGTSATKRPAARARGHRTRESHGEYYLSEAEVRVFEKDGILGPFPLLSAGEAAALAKRAEDQHARDFDGTTLIGERTRAILKKHGQWSINYSGLYQALRYPEWWDLLSSAPITQRIASLLGDDLLCWRSQFFEKKPGDIGTFWHQTGTFRECSTRPKLAPSVPMDESLVQLTAWVALTDVTVKNGCLRVLPGSHRNDRFERIAYNIKDQVNSYLLTLSQADIEKAIRAIKFTPGNFIKSQLVYDLALEAAPDLFHGYQVRDLEMKAGEFVIFTSLNTHGSYPNSSASNGRLAVGGRYTTTDVKVYDGFTHDVFPSSEGEIPFPIDKLACMPVLGEDRFGFNRLANRPASAPGSRTNDPSIIIRSSSSAASSRASPS